MTHLSSEQISEWTLGERSSEVRRHLESCANCSDEILHLQTGLQAYRQSVRDWAERSTPLGMPSHRVAASVSWAWATTTAVAITAALFPLFLDVRQAQREAESAQDSVLLNQVQERLGRTVPQSMQLLMELMNEGKEGEQ